MTQQQKIKINPSLFDLEVSPQDNSSLNTKEDQIELSDESEHSDYERSDSSTEIKNEKNKKYKPVYKNHSLFTGENAFNIYDDILKTYDPLASEIVNKRKNDYTKVFDELIGKYKTIGKLEKIILNNPEIRLSYYAISDGFIYSKMKSRSILPDSSRGLKNDIKASKEYKDSPLNNFFNIL
jgi:hypothetical protein